MKKIFSNGLLLLIIWGIMLLPSCLDVETSESVSSQTSETKQSSSIQSTENDKENNKEIEYGDSELKIIYPRPTGNPLIKLGSSGDDVGWVQTALNKAMNANITVDCSFGNETESKVVSFQSRCGLQADGVVGAMTISKLVNIVSGKETMPKEVIIPVTTSPPTQNNNNSNDNNNTSDSRSIVDEPQVHESQYVINTNTRKFHVPSCSSVRKINAENRLDYYGTKEDLLNQGYEPCQKCYP